MQLSIHRNIIFSLTRVGMLAEMSQCICDLMASRLISSEFVFNAVREAVREAVRKTVQPNDHSNHCPEIPVD